MYVYNINDPRVYVSGLQLGTQTAQTTQTNNLQRSVVYVQNIFDRTASASQATMTPTISPLYYSSLTPSVNPLFNNIFITTYTPATSQQVAATQAATTDNSAQAAALAAFEDTVVTGEAPAARYALAETVVDDTQTAVDNTQDIDEKEIVSNLLSQLPLDQKGNTTYNINIIIGDNNTVESSVQMSNDTFEGNVNTTNNTISDAGGNNTINNPENSDSTNEIIPETNEAVVSENETPVSNVNITNNIISDAGGNNTINNPVNSDIAEEETPAVAKSEEQTSVTNSASSLVSENTAATTAVTTSQATTTSLSEKLKKQSHCRHHSAHKKRIEEEETRLTNEIQNTEQSKIAKENELNYLRSGKSDKHLDTSMLITYLTNLIESLKARLSSTQTAA